MECLTPQVIKHVLKELKDIEKETLEGIRLELREDHLDEIHAFIEGPQGTPYEGGQFKIKLVLGNEFPDTPPKGMFMTKIFHPNVSSTGEICVNTLKKDWKKELGLKHILLTVKCLLIHPNPESALNEEAGRLLLEKYEDYFKHAKLMTSIHAKDVHQLRENEDVNSTTSSGGYSDHHHPIVQKLHENNTTNNKSIETKRNLRRL